MAQQIDSSHFLHGGDIHCPRLEVNGIGITIWLCLKTMYPQLQWIIIMFPITLR